MRHEHVVSVSKLTHASPIGAYEVPDMETHRGARARRWVSRLSSGEDLEPKFRATSPATVGVGAEPIQVMISVPCDGSGEQGVAREVAASSVWPAGDKVIVVIPAYNEAQYIGNVVRQVSACQRLGIVQGIIVVDDGSSDDTGRIAGAEGAQVIELSPNQGKSRAVLAATQHCRRLGATILLMLDADLGLIEPWQLKALIAPLIRVDGPDMVVGTVRGDLTGLSGQRALRLRVLAPLFNGSATWRKKLLDAGYGLEVALHYLLRSQTTAATEFQPARPAEGKNLGVKGDVDATNKYFSQRDALAHLLREKRRRIRSLPAEVRSVACHRLRCQARDLERQCYQAHLDGCRRTGEPEN